MDPGEAGLGAETLPGPPQVQWWAEFFLIKELYFFWTFEHFELSHAGSWLTVYTRVVQLMVMVTSPHMSFKFFFLLFFIK
jgi:hypothetical protein